MKHALLTLVALAALPPAAAAQSSAAARASAPAADTVAADDSLVADDPIEAAVFVTLHGADTVVTEEFARHRTSIEGRLRFPAAKHLSERYRAIVAPDATLPLIEVTVRNGPDTGKVQAKFTQRTRLIFRDDSVAVDDMTMQGLRTIVLGTERGALPYLNLSVGLLEQALRRARVLGAGARVPFFNASGSRGGGGQTGGQTVAATFTPIGADSVALAIGAVEYRLYVDGEGRLLGGTIPAQQVSFKRVPAR